VVAVLAVGLFALAGLVVDGGRALAAKSQAISLAAEAARAGAQQLDAASLHASGSVGLDPPAARAAASAFLTANHADGIVTANTTTVTVTVTIHTATTLLGLIGVPTLTESGTATAGLIATADQAGPP
jgi:Flp pilus assembly protein TadG